MCNGSYSLYRHSFKQMCTNIELVLHGDWSGHDINFSDKKQAYKQAGKANIKWLHLCRWISDCCITFTQGRIANNADVSGNCCCPCDTRPPLSSLTFSNVFNNIVCSRISLELQETTNTACNTFQVTISAWGRPPRCLRFRFHTAAMSAPPPPMC